MRPFSKRNGLIQLINSLSSRFPGRFVFLPCSFVPLLLRGLYERLEVGVLDGVALVLEAKSKHCSLLYFTCLVGQELRFMTVTVALAL